MNPAAFGRLCVETLPEQIYLLLLFQPPSGGCVLKHRHSGVDIILITPAAFGRLCVETGVVNLLERMGLPAAFGRLCVETKRSLKKGIHK